MRRTLILVFTLSGVSGLIYESVWAHYLKLFLGHAAFAQSLVLAVFMGGMALGSLLVGRRSGKWGNLLRGYAVVEGVLGLLAIAFHPVFVASTSAVLDRLLPALEAPSVAVGLQWLLAVVLILPQSVLLGMTFPLMSAGLVRRFPERPGAILAILYFANAIGGVVGVLTGGFFLINRFGLPGTILLAGCLNLLLAVFVWVRVGGEAEPRPSVSVPVALRSDGEPRRDQETPSWQRLLLLVALLTGLASFVYEIVWIRMLSLVLSSSTHAFELMLSAFILGLALGGLWIRRRIDDLKEPVRFLAWVQIAMGALALSTLLTYGQMFRVMEWLQAFLDPSRGGYLAFNFGSHAIAMAVMVPATFCAGMTLPLITHILLQKGYGESSIGKVYGLNTIGAVAGVLLALHLGLVNLGLKGTLVAGVVIDLGVGLALLWREAERLGKRIPLATSLASAALVVVAVGLFNLDYRVMASGVYRANVSLASLEGVEVLEHRDGKTASISLTREGGRMLTLRSNGKPEASVGLDSGSAPPLDEAINVLAAGLPLSLHPEAERAAVIGMGSGITSQTLLSAANLGHVHTIEIEPAMVALAQELLPRNEGVFQDPRSRVSLGDARTVLARSADEYDLIISRPSNPWVSGTSSLHSVEFYQRLRKHLRPGGLLVQWIQIFETDPRLVMSILRALETGFRDYDIYAGSPGDLLIVASPDGPVPEPDPGFFAESGVAAEMERIGVRSVQDLAFRKAGDRRSFRPFMEMFPEEANSDYRPVVDQKAARARVEGRNAGELLLLMVQPFAIREYLGILRPSWSSTDLTPSPLFFLSSQAAQAVAFRDRMLGDTLSARYSAGPWRDAMVDAIHLEAACDSPAGGHAGVGDLYAISEALAPYLTGEEVSRVWHAMGTRRCGMELDPDEAPWWELFRAVGERNVGEILNLFEDLSRDRAHPTPVSRRYLLAVGMAAHFSIGDPEAALEMWEAWGPVAVGLGEPPLLFRYLSVLGQLEAEGSP